MNFQSSLFREVSLEAIRKIFAGTLHEDSIREARLLDGGMFNTTYFVIYGQEGKERQAVLRLGPVNRERLMGFEENLMRAEEYVYALCQEIGIPCSNVLACDTSRQLIDRDFMIVEYIPSVVMSNAPLTREQQDSLYFRLGEYLRQFHGVTGQRFGFVSRILEGKAFSKWSDALAFEVEDMSGKLERAGGASPEEGEAIRRPFYEERNRKLLDEIQTPHLLHTDLWAGNVLLDRDTLEVKAIIDSDRAMFGDPDFEFSSPWMNIPPMEAGYGLEPPETWSWQRKRRKLLYRSVYLLLEAYVGIGEYNNPQLYRERKEQLMETLAKLEFL